MKRILILAVILTSFVFAGCKTNEEHANHRATNANTAKNVEDTTFKNIYKAEIKVEPAAIKANEKVKFTLTVKNEKSEVLKDFQIVHEKLLHLLIVPEDLSTLYHVHPEMQADGTFLLDFTFPNSGRYYAFADYTPKGANQIVDRLPIEIADGDKPAAIPLKADEKLEKTVENVKVRMETGGNLESNKEMMLNFSVFDAQTSELAAGMEKYLGEAAHFVIISQDLRDFVHAHPVSNDNTKSEHQHTGGTEHRTNNKMMNAPPNSMFSSHVTFPNAGLYRIFVEVKRAGKVILTPFTVNVAQGKTDKILTDAKIPAGAIKIVVSKDGFTPNEVSLNTKDAVKLAFLRVDAENCADEVVFKDLNIRKKLPVGEVVVIDLPKGKTGEINFACGMDMYKGKLIIQ